jgi:hypothetical protein
MCSPSSGLKAINSGIQQFAGTMVNQAKSIFGSVSGAFNTVVNSLTGVANAGASQFGMSAGQFQAENAAAVQAGATEARNLTAAAASQVGAMGGGNVVTPAGGTQASVLAAKTQAAQDTASAENQILQQGYQIGNANWRAAIQGLEQAPGMFNPATSAGQAATTAQGQAFKSQQEIDQQSNWAGQLGENLLTSAVGSFAGGAGMALTGGLNKLGGLNSIGQGLAGGQTLAGAAGGAGGISSYFGGGAGGPQETTSDVGNQI